MGLLKERDYILREIRLNLYITIFVISVMFFAQSFFYGNTILIIGSFLFAFVSFIFTILTKKKQENE